MTTHYRKDGAMQATEDKTYEGWSNYATWGVALVLNNEESTCRAIRDEMVPMARASAVAYLAGAL